ncbi:Bestrophin, RFP-TM, chloride channel-domain-containing protein, partial [Baffinella frigidus]
GFSPLPHSLTAGALSLMLVFRTNSAYDRFWEARKLWGQLVNLTRECGRFGHTVLTGLDRDHYLAMVAAFPSFLLQHLQAPYPPLLNGKENAYRPTKATFSEKQRTVLSGLLGETDMKILWACRHRPFMVTKMMSGIMMKGLTSKEALVSRFGPINPDGTPDEKFHAMVVQSQLTAERAHFESLNKEFSGVYGACERLIKSSVTTHPHLAKCSIYPRRSEGM